MSEYKYTDGSYFRKHCLSGITFSWNMHALLKNYKHLKSDKKWTHRLIYELINNAFEHEQNNSASFWRYVQSRTEPVISLVFLRALSQLFNESFRYHWNIYFWKVWQVRRYSTSWEVETISDPKRSSTEFEPTTHSLVLLKSCAFTVWLPGPQIVTWYNPLYLRLTIWPKPLLLH